MYILINTNNLDFPTIVSYKKPIMFSTEEDAANYGNSYVGMYVIVKIN
jgi:hypothetical protein